MVVVVVVDFVSGAGAGSVVVVVLLVVVAGSAAAHGRRVVGGLLGAADHGDRADEEEGNEAGGFEHRAAVPRSKQPVHDRAESNARYVIFDRIARCDLATRNENVVENSASSPLHHFTLVTTTVAPRASPSCTVVPIPIEPDDKYCCTCGPPSVADRLPGERRDHVAGDDAGGRGGTAGLDLRDRQDRRSTSSSSRTCPRRLGAAARSGSAEIEVLTVHDLVGLRRQLG